MKKIIDFETSYKEPIVIFNKVFGIKILSAHEVMLGRDVFRRLVKKCTIYRENSHVIKMSVLVCMCLYSASGKKVFSNPEEVLKNLTLYEIKYIFREYFKVKKSIILHANKMEKLLSDLKNIS